MHLLLHYRRQINNKQIKYFKGQVHCFLMQVVIKKCFLLNPEKNLAQIRLVVYEKMQKRTFKSTNDVTEPKARLLY